MNLQIVNASIFTTGAKYIAHQTNCKSNYAAGLARSMFDLYPYADCYKSRFDSIIYNKDNKDNIDIIDSNCSAPGNIHICGDGLKERYIINMFGQYEPGTACTNSDEYDSKKNREKWFFECLMEISKIQDLHSIAFPYYIGCGLAGGNWNWYFNKLQKFSKYVEKKAVVLLYKLEK